MSRAKLHFVKKARKDNPVAKKGEPYYWWKANRFSPMRYSLKPPKGSQLESTPFMQGICSIQEDMAEATAENAEDLQGMVDEWKGQIEELREELQGSLDNMPEGIAARGYWSIVARTNRRDG